MDSDKNVHFDNGTKVQADVIIYATGYLIDFEFIKKDILKVQNDNRVFLYKNILDPKNKNLFFIGLCQPLGIS
jgi:dimethylaniline monooxygenase (N-oxide forming)